MKFTLDDGAFLVMLNELSNRDLKIAAVWALNDTAADVLKDQQNRMDTVFDRPTDWTKNAFMVWKATPATLEAQVLERPSVGRRHYLKVQESGGDRPQTGVEKLLGAAASAHGAIAAITPAGGARLDAHGNWSRGERNQVLSQLKAGREVGFSSNETAASRKRAPKNQKRYFVSKEGNARTPGVYTRNEDGSLDKILNFLKTPPTYTARLGFYDGAEDVYRVKLPEHLSRTIAKMVAKRSGGGST